jgi:hypothetical protein
MAGILTKGIKLSYSTTGTSTYTALTNLQEIPEIGNGAREKIETTTLADDTKQYIAGLGDGGQELSFKFLYDKDQFESLIDLEGSCFWKVELPDGINANFKGVPAVKLNSASPNNAITYTLVITVESEIAFI